MPHLQKKPSAVNETAMDSSAEEETRKLTQTDHLNKILLKAFLQHINNDNEVDRNVVVSTSVDAFKN